MSAQSQTAKFRFGGFFKSLFGKSEANDESIAASRAEMAPAGSAQRQVTPGTLIAQQYAQARNGNGHTQRTANVNGKVISISLQSIICSMSPDLRSRVRQPVTDDLSVAVPLDKITPQLAQGSVKIPFGDIRRAAAHIFAPAQDADHLLVSLPLGEILPLLNPSMLSRRTVQKHTEVSEEITGPFANGGQGLTILNESASANSAAQTPPPAARQVAPGPSSIQRGVPPRNAVNPAAAPGTSFFKREITPPTPLPVPRNPVNPASLPGTNYFKREMIPPTPVSHAPVNPGAPSGPSRVTGYTPAPRTQGPAPTPSVVIPQTPKPALPEGPPLVIPMGALAESWPEALRLEINRLNLAEAQVALPSGLVEHGLKRGRVAFPWKLLRSWIRPAPLPSISVNDSTELELPLKVLAPLFVARQKAAGKGQKKVAVDESIPNLFFGFPQPEAPPPPAAPAAQVNKPADTNYYVWNDGSDNARVDETEYKRPAPSGTDFVNRYATPNEIVSRAASLDGVAGALIALPDGLMVASRIPQDLNGDTLAAFLPQLFNKMSQCTRELRMGELNNLNFTVGNVPWKIFRVNAVFFAAFGRAGQGLPTAQLAALAGELDRKNK